MNHSRIKPYRELLAEYGCQFEGVHETGKHPKLVFRIPSGRTILKLPFPKSPSDNKRGFKNFETRLRHKIAEASG